MRKVHIGAVKMWSFVKGYLSFSKLRVVAVLYAENTTGSGNTPTVEATALTY